MVFLLSFLMFFAAATTGLLLAVDSLYARTRADQRLDHSQGKHWGPDSVLLEDPAAGRSLLPAAVRPRLWLALGGLFLLGCGTLVLAS